MQKSGIIHDMTEGNVFSQMIRFSIPFMLASLLQSLYAAVDMIVVGHFVGQEGLSAISVAGQVTEMFTFFCFGFASASQVLIAQYVGAKQDEGIQRTIGTSFSFLLLFALACGAVCVALASPLLELLNIPPEAKELGVQYLVICGCGMVFIFGYNTVSAVLRGMGDSKRPLLFILIAAVVNVIGDLLLVGVFRMGVAGAAVATVAGQGVSFIWSAIYLYRRREEICFDFRPRSFRIHGQTMKSLARMGFPMALQNATIIFSVMVVNAQINGFGVSASAITGLGSKLNALTSIVSNAVCQAMSTVVGQNIAAGRRDRVVQAVRSALAVSLVSMAVICLFCGVFPKEVFGIFTSEAAVLDMARIYMPFLIIGFLGNAAMGPYYWFINGIGNAGLTFVIGLCDGIVARIGLAMLLGISLKMGIRGFWLGCALAGWTTYILSAIYYYSGKWKSFRIAIAQRDS